MSSRNAPGGTYWKRQSGTCARRFKETQRGELSPPAGGKVCDMAKKAARFGFGNVCAG